MSAGNAAEGQDPRDRYSHGPSRCARAVAKCLFVHNPSAALGDDRFSAIAMMNLRMGSSPL